MKGNTVTTDSLILKNRLLKNQKKLKSYINKGNLEAYRLYNKDIPEYPYLIDIYGKHAVIYEQGKKLSDEDRAKRELHQKDIETVLEEAFQIPLHISISKPVKDKKEMSSIVLQMIEKMNF